MTQKQALQLKGVISLRERNRIGVEVWETLQESICSIGGIDTLKPSSEFTIIYTEIWMPTRKHAQTGEESINKYNFKKRKLYSLQMQRVWR